MNVCDEFKIIVKCSRWLSFIAFINEFAYSKIANISARWNLAAKNIASGPPKNRTMISAPVIRAANHSSLLHYLSANHSSGPMRQPLRSRQTTVLRNTAMDWSSRLQAQRRFVTSTTLPQRFCQCGPSRRQAFVASSKFSLILSMCVALCFQRKTTHNCRLRSEKIEDPYCVRSNTELRDGCSVLPHYEWVPF